MNDPSHVLEKMAELDRQHRPVVSVTLVEAIGSTPQDVGARMLVDAQGLLMGTIGGGRVERKAIEEAGQLLGDSGGSRCRLVTWNLQTDVGMTCGGVVRLFFEAYQHRAWSIVLFGAGHVAQALVRLLLTLDCHITCVDPRQEWLDRLPDSPRLSKRREEQPESYVELLSASDFVLCMTMGHRTDRPILERIFRLGRTFPYLGVIGSAAKRKVLLRELAEAGIDDLTAQQFACPIGLPIGSNDPAEIAVSVTAQLIQQRDQSSRPV
jgi:xanthine dehydrogenase accessory factor